MFGKNEIAAPFRHDDGRLLVNDLFYTLQGEGPDAGRPAIFLRLSKCNLRCFFCDTEFESGTWNSLDDLRRKIGELASRTGCNLLVITGGEPLLQNIIPLVEWCCEIDVSVAIETAGTVYLDRLREWFAYDRSIGGNIIVCSPKTPNLNSQIIPLIGALKYIVEKGAVDEATGIPNLSTQVAGKSSMLFHPRSAPDALVYLQPMDPGEGNAMRHSLNTDFARDLCLKHGRRMSVQVHKIVGLP